MAQWWELAIPGTAAVLGGWVGAWWQGRTGERVLAAQLSDARAARQEESDRERRARLLDQRRETYTRVLTLLEERIALRSRLDDANAALEAVRQRQESQPDPSALQAALEDSLQESSALAEVSGQIVHAIQAVLLIAPAEVCVSLDDPGDDPESDERIHWAFLQAARKDIRG